MPTERLSMRKIKEILRLKYEANLKHRQIASSINISPSTVSKIVNDALAHQITWPLPNGMDETALEQLIYGTADTRKGDYVQPDFLSIYNELQRHKHLTKQLLWEEYYAQHGAKSYSYSQFCNLFRDWLGKRQLSMRQIHQAGEKLFVDYAGQTVPIKDPKTGAVVHAQIFLAVLGASNYTFAEATLTQSLPDWIQSHVRAFKYLGGTPEIVVPDNLKSGVHKSCQYDPDINPTYHQMACHYNVAIIPTRTRAPKDKAKVETGVKVVEQWILARLRNTEFFSLGELNAAIKRLLVQLNDKPFQKLPGCRRSQFVSLDKPTLKPLPTQQYNYTEIQYARVGVDYHVEHNGHYYSVPYALTKKRVELHLENNTVSIYHKGQRVAVHAKSSNQGLHTTCTEHMPKAHQYYANWSPTKFLQQAEKLGPYVKEIIQIILNERRHLEQSYRTCLGILNLEKDYDANRLNNACQRAIEIGAPRRKHVQLILQNGMDRIDDNNEAQTFITNNHENIRGSEYYQ